MQLLIAYNTPLISANPIAVPAVWNSSPRLVIIALSGNTALLRPQGSFDARLLGPLVSPGFVVSAVCGCQLSMHWPPKSQGTCSKARKQRHVSRRGSVHLDREMSLLP